MRENGPVPQGCWKNPAILHSRPRPWNHQSLRARLRLTGFFLATLPTPICRYTLVGGGYIAVTKMEGRQILETYYHAVTMDDLCKDLSSGSFPIHDATGLTGRYDFRWKANPNPSGSDVTPWLLDQIGLELKPGKYHGFSIVVDHVERPTAN